MEEKFNIIITPQLIWDNLIEVLQGPNPDSLLVEGLLYELARRLKAGQPLPMVQKG